ncbi:hypothetical protein F5X99DRAFT_430777 [Biscogniauxia marginata]|nr:hypothetical protein F5X99DRAFT_430777 [Biscogniauxia marginata]
MIFMVEQYGAVYNGIVRLREQMDLHATNIAAGERLPHEVETALYRLCYTLLSYIKGLLSEISVAMPASPPLRSHFVRFNEECNVIEKHATLTVVEEELMFLFGNLIQDEELAKQVGYGTMLAEYEMLMHNDPAAKTLVSSLIAKYMADFSIFCECFHQLELFFYGVTGFGDLETSVKVHADDIHNSFLESTPYLNRFLAHHRRHDPFDKLRHLLSPFEGRLHYPVGKRRTRETSQAMQEAEANLDKLWVPILDSYSAADTFSPRVKSVLFWRELRRTQSWVEIPTTPKDHQAPKQSIYEWSVSWSTGESNEPRVEEPNLGKLKTRGKSSSLQTPIAAINPSNKAKKYVQRFIRLDKRSLEIFEILFFTPGSSSRPGEVHWPDFLKAMAAVGFAAEKLGGSVWHFYKQPDSDNWRPINFHEPHTKSKLSFSKARQYGRRLERAYVHEDREPESLKQWATKAKANTRGKAIQCSGPSPGEVQGEKGDSSSPEDDKESVYKVDKRALKVFKGLFHDPLASEQLREIPWSDYLYAMTVDWGFDQKARRVRMALQATVRLQSS